MFCANCGKKIASEGEFCQYCGHNTKPLQEAIDEETKKGIASASETNQTKLPLKKRVNWNTILLWISAFTITVTIIDYAAQLINGKLPPSNGIGAFATWVGIFTATRYKAKGKSVLKGFGLGFAIALLSMFAISFSYSYMKSSTISSKTKSEINTRLMWAKDGNIAGKQMNWHDATAFVQNMNYEGFNDWRLPTKEELEYFMKQSSLNSGTFKNMQHDHYWTSSTPEAYPDNAASVNHSLKSASYMQKSNSGSVWPVRDTKN